MKPRTIIASGLVLLVVSFGCRQKPGAVQPFPDPGPHETLWRVADPKAASRLVRVLEEIQTHPDHPWAGRYVLSERPDRDRLVLAPQSGYVLISGQSGSCCKGTDRGQPCSPDCPGAREAVEGEIVITREGRLRLALELSPGHIILAGEFTPLTVAGRCYLIATDELDAFQRAVREGREPRTRLEGLFLMRAP